MLLINLKRIFALRGIDKPFAVLVKNGFSPMTATNLLNNKTKSIKYKHLERICEILNCEPNDLFDWKPSRNTQNPENHPLKDLKRTDPEIEIAELMKTIPLEKMDEIQNMLKEIKESE